MRNCLILHLGIFPASEIHAHGVAFFKPIADFAIEPSGHIGTLMG